MLEPYQGKLNVETRSIGLGKEVRCANEKRLTCGKRNGATKRSSAATVVVKLALLFFSQKNFDFVLNKKYIDPSRPFY